MKFANVLKKIILEQSRLEVLMDKWVLPKKDKEGKTKKAPLTKDEFFELIQADPGTKLKGVNLDRASKEELSRVKVGGYTPWLIKKYLNVTTERQPGDQGYEAEVKQMKERFMEDLYKVKEDLRKFDRFKHKLPLEFRNINKLTPQTLFDKVKDFSLEKTKATKDDKIEAAKTYKHPGGEIVYRGKKWTVVKISDKGEIGHNAACFYGGYGRENFHLGETNWCTASPGLKRWFDNYINRGPLYIIIPNNSDDLGEKSGLPVERYQFHFPSDSFMDREDAPIDLVDYLNGPMEELKQFFKPEFAKGLTEHSGKQLVINNFNSGAVGKFVALYGLDELFESLPEDLIEINISNDGRQQVNIAVPESISRFKELEALIMYKCVSSIPDSICQLKKLRFLLLSDSPNLRTIPACIADLPELMFLNVTNNPGLQIPEEILQKGNEIQPDLFDFSGSDLV